MGLFNKLKNVLFEETEVEEPEEKEEFVEENLNDKIQKATMNLPKINRDSKKRHEIKESDKEMFDYDVEEEPDHELFKIEKTFDFPAFDEDEFDDFLPKKKEEPKIEEDPIEYVKPEKTRSATRVTKTEVTTTRVVREEITEEPRKAFRPSPVISPVYGILDKNYKKEDVITRDEKLSRDKVKLDVDSVRKKAFGALEEDLAKEDDEPIIKFYGDIDEVAEETKKEPEVEEEIVIDTEESVMNNLLDKSIEDEIDVTKEMEIPKDEEDELEIVIDEELDEEEPDEIDEMFEDTKKTIDDIEDEVTNELEDIEEEQNETAEDIIEEEIEEEKKKEEKSDDDENDLFELIDSMYDNKEED